MTLTTLPGRTGTGERCVSATDMGLPKHPLPDTGGTVAEKDHQEVRTADGNPTVSRRIGFTRARVP